MSVKPKKSLGQNFLKNPDIAHAMIAASDVNEGDTVIEVGPGTGMLTRELLRAGAQVVAVEKDRRLIASLEKQFREAIEKNQFTVVYGDILEQNMKTLSGSNSFKVVANIPYYLTGELFRVLFEKTPLPQKVAVMVQKEVAERIYARDGKESILSISVKVFGNPRIERIVPRTSFTPVPDVDSAIVSISDIADPFGNEQVRTAFFTLVKTGFRHKRKVLRGNLTEAFDDDSVNHAFQKCDIAPKTRAENLSVSDWQCLSAYL